MAVFEGDFDFVLETDGVGKVPAVADLVGFVGTVFFVDDGAAEGVGVLLHAPALGEVVFSAGAVEAWWPGVEFFP